MVRYVYISCVCVMPAFKLENTKQTNRPTQQQKQRNHKNHCCFVFVVCAVALQVLCFSVASFDMFAQTLHVRLAASLLPWSSHSTLRLMSGVGFLLACFEFWVVVCRTSQITSVGIKASLYLCSSGDSSFLLVFVFEKPY